MVRDKRDAGPKSQRSCQHQYSQGNKEKTSRGQTSGFPGRFSGVLLHRLRIELPGKKKDCFVQDLHHRSP